MIVQKEGAVIRMTQTIKVKNIEMDYIRFGSGEKILVILPGVSVRSVLFSAMAIESAYCCFTAEYTVYLFDRRNDMPQDYTIRQMADDTAEVMTALGIGSANVFGTSQGGMMAMCLAIDHPELVGKLVLASTAARMSDEINSGTAQWIALAESGDLTAMTAALIDDLYSEETIGKYRDALMHMNDQLTQKELDRFIIQVRALNGFDVYDELERITCPTLVIGADGDKLLPADCSRELAERLNCGLYLYGAEYGHCVYDEAPDYKQRLLAFFDNNA